MHGGSRNPVADLHICFLAIIQLTPMCFCPGSTIHFINDSQELITTRRQIQACTCWQTKTCLWYASMTLQGYRIQKYGVRPQQKTATCRHPTEQHIQIFEFIQTHLNHLTLL